MSGGSYNYLCHCTGQDILTDYSKLKALDNMIERLSTLGWQTELDLSLAVKTKLKKIEAILIELDSDINKIAEVWKAVEWHDSNDGSKLFDQLKAKYEQGTTTHWLDK